MNEIMLKELTKCRNPGIKMVIADTEGEYKDLAEMFGGEIIKMDFSKSKGGWINPFTGESNTTEKLKEKAKKAIKSRKYKKAYRLLRQIKKLTFNAI